MPRSRPWEPSSSQHDEDVAERVDVERRADGRLAVVVLGDRDDVELDVRRRLGAGVTGGPQPQGVALAVQLVERPGALVDVDVGGLLAAHVLRLAEGHAAVGGLVEVVAEVSGDGVAGRHRPATEGVGDEPEHVLLVRLHPLPVRHRDLGEALQRVGAAAVGRPRHGDVGEVDLGDVDVAGEVDRELGVREAGVRQARDRVDRADRGAVDEAPGAAAVVGAVLVGLALVVLRRTPRWSRRPPPGCRSGWCRRATPTTGPRRGGS